MLGVVARLLDLADAAADRLAGARPRRPRAGAPALRVRRRRPRAARGLGRRRAGSAGGSTPRTARRSSSRRSPQGTWRAGLDRLLLGVDDDRGRAAAVRRRAAARRRRQRRHRPRRAASPSCVDRLHAALDALSDAPSRSTPGRPALADAADALTATRRRDAWQRAELAAPARRRRREAADERRRRSSRWPRCARCSPTASQGRPTRANFRTGHLTVCTLVPMRSVPHRVVCLLGLDDGVFPRRPARRRRPDARRPARRRPRRAQRGPPAAARRAAGRRRDRLIVTYTGNDERTNSPRPPAVPVGELLDVVDRTVRRTTAAARDASSSAIRCSRSTRATSRPASSCRRRRGASTASTLDGARALATDARRPRPFLAAPLPRDASRGGRARRPRALRRAPGAGVPAPAARHQRRRLRATRSRTPCRSSSTARALGRRQRLLDARLAGAEHRGRGRGRDRARRRCRPGELAEPVIARCSARSSTQIVARPRRGARRWRRAGVGRRPGRARRRPAAERHGPRRPRRRAADRHLLARRTRAHRLAAWVRLLALTAAYPDAAVRGRDVGTRDAARRRARSTVADRAARRDAGRRASSRSSTSRRCVDLYDRGMREPLPLACMTSAAYARPPRRRRRRRRPGARRGSRAGTSDARTASPSTSSSSAACAASTSCSRSRRAPTSRATAGTTTETTPLRPLRPAAVGRPARREEVEER